MPAGLEYGLVGGAVGGIAGAVGGAIEAANQRAEMARFRRRQRLAIGQAFERGDVLTQALTGADYGVDLDTVQAQGGTLGRGIRRQTGPSLFQLGENFLRGTFSDPTSSPLVQNVAKQIRAAQAARGTLGGGAAVSAEALGSGVAAAELQQSLLPQLLEYTQFPELLRQRIIGFEAPLLSAMGTGAALPGMTPPSIAPSVFGAGLGGFTSGALGGFQIGQAFGGQSAFDSRLAALEGGVRNPNPTLSADQLNNIMRGFGPGYGGGSAFDTFALQGRRYV